MSEQVRSHAEATRQLTGGQVPDAQSVDDLDPDDVPESGMKLCTPSCLHCHESQAISQ
ncbi:hypothetical protein [Aquipuribacter hungaricus]|uniref:Uncharacterized protein n=2 Tax=Aquipuribacter hungaricus TaxID=545624 RepID=A0ABV7WH93_9MICO